ncbi:MAG: hypothetical protein EA364_04290, partial [Balneolaceae bacterium]
MGYKSELTVRNRISRIRFNLCLLLFFLVSQSVIAQTTHNWVGGSSGDWSVASNWNPAGIPGSGDTAIIASGGVVISNDVIVSGMSLSGNLTINSTLTIQSTFIWSSGTLTGSGTLELPVQTVSNFTTSGKTISGALTINQAGTVNWTGGGISQGLHTGAINNSGLFDMQGDLTIGDGGGFGGTLNNTGTFRKSAGTGTGLISNSVRLANSGTIEALSGTLSIQAGAFNSGTELLHSGAFHIGANGELRFTVGTHRIAETGVISAPG